MRPCFVLIVEHGEVGEWSICDASTFVNGLDAGGVTVASKTRYWIPDFSAGKIVDIELPVEEPENGLSVMSRRGLEKRPVHEGA